MRNYRTRLLNNELDWIESLPWENSCEEWSEAGAEVIKQSRSRFAFVWNGISKVFIKRYLARRFSARWLSWLRGCKAYREARTLRKLRKHDIPAPEPLAVVRPLIPFGQKASYVVQEFLPGRDLLDIASSSTEEEQHTLTMAATRLGEILAAMHSIGFFHTDAHLCNFMLHDESNELYVIDVDDGRFFPRLLAYHRRKNIHQIIQSGRRVTDQREWERNFYEAYAWCSGSPMEDIAVQ